jgi:hypothetical protein
MGVFWLVCRTTIRFPQVQTCSNALLSMKYKQILLNKIMRNRGKAMFLNL